MKVFTYAYSMLLYSTDYCSTNPTYLPTPVSTIRRTTSHYTTLHHPTLHYTTLHKTTLHYPTPDTTERHQNFTLYTLHTTPTYLILILPRIGE